MAKFSTRNVNYGKKFKRGNRLVMYRYLNKKKSTKTLVDAKTKKVITGSGSDAWHRANYKRR